jgi:hypothetical protein
MMEILWANKPTRYRECATGESGGADRLGYTSLTLDKPDQHLVRERRARTLAEICDISPMWRWNDGYE